jgi:hypothetical protein
MRQEPEDGCDGNSGKNEDEFGLDVFHTECVQ